MPIGSLFVGYSLGSEQVEKGDQQYVHLSKEEHSKLGVDIHAQVPKRNCALFSAYGVQKGVNVGDFFHRQAKDVLVQLRN